MNHLSPLPSITLADGISGRIREGAGESVLWLHGYTVDSSMWGDMWNRLPGFRHVGVDLPGHGASQPLAQMGDLPSLGRKLGQLCVDQGIRHIVAISFGTLTATQVALAFPAHFSTITLSAPSLAGGPHEADIARVYGQLVRYYYQFGRGPWMRDIWMKCRIFAGLEDVDGLRESIASLIDKHSWDEIQGMTMQLFTQPPQSEEALRTIEASLLVLLGERELPAFRTVAETLHRAVPRCRVEEIPGGDHLAMIQHPEISARAIERHLVKKGKDG